MLRGGSSLATRTWRCSEQQSGPHDPDFDASVFGVVGSLNVRAGLGLRPGMANS